MSRAAGTAGSPMTKILTVKQLRGARALSGLGVRELAKIAGLSPTAVSQLENGRIKSPRASTLERLRTALEDHGVEFGSKGWIRHVGDDPDESADRPTLPPN